MILLDTNALIWLAHGEPRARPLARYAGKMFISPATKLELTLLKEVGRTFRISGLDVHPEGAWALDDPPSIAWFSEAERVSWTRDPFDRLIVAHASFRRWKLATADRMMLEVLPATSVIAL